MKIRKGFVSNSSSSSFIVSLDRKPESARELQRVLFGSEECFNHPYENIKFGTDVVAEYIYLYFKLLKINIV